MIYAASLSVESGWKPRQWRFSMKKEIPSQVCRVGAACFHIVDVEPQK